MKKFNRSYKDIITLENLLLAWQEFLLGKSTKKDVVLFQSKLIDNVYLLLQELEQKTYRHGKYKKFNICDPKPRIIHKAQVRDRILHHLLYKELYPHFDNYFIFDSYSCRVGKGTHNAMNKLKIMARKISKNHTTTCWVLQCDIKKFFANINHKILKKILAKYIRDEDILWLFGKIIDSFHAKNKIDSGLPLGNLTSQLLVNIYMNEFDQYVKHKLKIKWYIRYADDFIILSEDKNKLKKYLLLIDNFLVNNLNLLLHPDKVHIKTFSSGVDFLGWVHFPQHSVLRTKTKRRMLKKIKNNPTKQVLASYISMLKHGNAHNLSCSIQQTPKAPKSQGGKVSV